MTDARLGQSDVQLPPLPQVSGLTGSSYFAWAFSHREKELLAALRTIDERDALLERLVTAPSDDSGFLHFARYVADDYRKLKEGR